MFLQQLVNGLVIGGIYAMIAVGYTMIYGVIQLINFAHGEIYMLGAFFALTFITFSEPALLRGLSPCHGLLWSLRGIAGCHCLSSLAAVTPVGGADYGHRDVDIPAESGHDHLGLQAQAVSAGGAPGLF